MKKLRMLVTFFAVMAVASPAMARVLSVNCNVGQTITQALARAQPGDTIRVIGTCHEPVTITMDRLTIEGQGNPIINGGGGSQAAVTIDGVRGVTIRGLTVRNGVDGILVRRGAAVILESVTATENTDHGIRIDENSTARLTNYTARHNGGQGLRVLRPSSGTFVSLITSTENGGAGLFLASGSSGTAASATILAVTTQPSTSGSKAAPKKKLWRAGITVCPCSFMVEM